MCYQNFVLAFKNLSNLNCIIFPKISNSTYNLSYSLRPPNCGRRGRDTHLSAFVKYSSITNLTFPFLNENLNIKFLLDKKS